MVHAEVTADLQGGWGDVVTSSYPRVGSRILGSTLTGDSAIETIDISAADLVPVLGALEDHDSIRDAELVTRTDDRAIVRCESQAPTFLRASRTAGVPICPPALVQAGEVTFEVHASRDRLSTLVDELEAFGYEITVEALHTNGEIEALERDEFDRVLSDRQWQVVLTAIQAGYYETPRKCTLTELAERLGIAKSTCSELLRHAEASIVERFVEKFAGTLSDLERPERYAWKGHRGDLGIPETREEGSTTGEGCDTSELLDLLSNERVRQLLDDADEPKTVAELAEECSIPKTTAYRMTEKLADAGLLDPVTVRNRAGRPPAEYRRSAEGVVVRFRNGPTVESF